ncbi:uncharacterized protein PV09_00019 [Verruconis gallopava]|uniref:CENP-V/GFA domain-containing protein n=1 Tax=Verruconis gallopava TaxID=253628 RepID=A0A0D1Y209_9PEZI|nr:uncharacterized protein PV09_00019 [Verruconis gallopava]KIW09071.1 hypothetical protein PV09_00019 [Verruconis gallopava]
MRKTRGRRFCAHNHLRTKIVLYLRYGPRANKKITVRTRHKKIRSRLFFSMVVTGSCACGALKYQIDAEPPFKKALCHCGNCQKLSGTSYTTNVLVPRTSFKLLSGTPKDWSFTQNPSGIVFKTSFCGDCGGMIMKQSEDEAFKDVYIVQAGTADGDAFAGAPDVELWVPQRQAWVNAVHGAAQAQTFA